MNKEVKAMGQERELKALRDALEELSNDDWQVRLRAITTLVGLRRTDEFFREAIPCLIKATKDSEPLVRKAAIPALGDIGTKDQCAVACLKELLDSPDQDEVKGAVYSLGKIGPEAISTISNLINLFSSVNEETHKAISWAISIIGPDTLPSLRDSFKSNDLNTRRGAIISVGNMGPVAISLLDELIRSLSDLNPVIRLESARAIGNLRAASEVVDAIKDLSKLLDDPDPDVRWNTAEALRKIGTEEAMQAWANYKPISTVEAISQQLTNLDKAVRENAASSLYDIFEKGKDNKLELLSFSFNDNNHKVLINLCNSLEKLEEEAHPLLDKLITILEHEQPAVKKAAATVVGKIGPQYAEKAIDNLVKLLDDDDKDVRMAAAVGLELIGGKKAEKALKQFNWT